MASDDSNAQNPGGNPGITDVEPVNVSVQPDYGTGGVMLEIADRTGSGFRTIFDPDAAIDLCLKAIAAVARLRGYVGGTP